MSEPEKPSENAKIDWPKVYRATRRYGWAIFIAFVMVLCGIFVATSGLLLYLYPEDMIYKWLTGLREDVPESAATIDGLLARFVSAINLSPRLAATLSGVAASLTLALAVIARFRDRIKACWRQVLSYLRAAPDSDFPGAIDMLPLGYVSGAVFMAVTLSVHSAVKVGDTDAESFRVLTDVVSAAEAILQSQNNQLESLAVINEHGKPTTARLIEELKKTTGDRPKSLVAELESVHEGLGDLLESASSLIAPRQLMKIRSAYLGQRKLDRELDSLLKVVSPIQSADAGQSSPFHLAAARMDAVEGPSDDAAGGRPEPFSLHRFQRNVFEESNALALSSALVLSSALALPEESGTSDPANSEAKKPPMNAHETLEKAREMKQTLLEVSRAMMKHEAALAVREYQLLGSAMPAGFAEPRVFVFYLFHETSKGGLNLPKVQTDSLRELVDSLWDISQGTDHGIRLDKIEVVGFASAERFESAEPDANEDKPEPDPNLTLANDRAQIIKELIMNYWTASEEMKTASKKMELPLTFVSWKSLTDMATARFVNLTKDPSTLVKWPLTDFNRRTEVRVYWE